MMAEHSTFEAGDAVEWNTAQDAAMRIMGHGVAAAANPDYLVRSGASGARAAHRTGSLRTCA